MAASSWRAPGLLDPATLAGVANLRLVARHVVEGFLAGEHRDRRPDAGLEFNQYRSYEPGDDLRRVDWRVYARSDRYYVRESEVERDVTVRLLLDASASMGHREGDACKLDYARVLTAALAYLADRQGDRVAFHAVRDVTPLDLQPDHRRRSLDRLFHRLSELEPEGVWPAWTALGPRVANPRERELVAVVSDLWMRRREILEAVKSLRSLGQEVLVFHLLGRRELELGWSGDVLFEDLETGERVHGLAERMRRPYLERLADHLETWRRDLLALRVSYQLVPTDRAVDAVLRTFLLRRSRLP